MEERNNMLPSFQKGISYSDTNVPTGVTTLEKFTETKNLLEYNENLKLCDLSDYEIQIYNDYKNGIEYLENMHKNVEKSALNKILENIQDKILKNQANITNNSAELNQSETSLIHPINNLKDLQEDIFGHFDIDSLPSASKRQKIVRRMNRKFSKDIPIPESSVRYTNPAIKEKTHFYNDFIKLKNNTHTSITESNSKNKTNTKWDMRDTIKEEYKTSSKNTIALPKKQIGCSPKTLYTIRDNQIVRLEKKNNHKSDVSNRSLNDYNLVHLKLPINQTEKQILEGTKLNLEDIKSIPKFQNYNPGTPSKVLFLKNLHTNINENDIKNIFNEYGNCDIRLMKGKMKGQAFLTYETTDIASKILNEKNGIILGGKPIIIQYGKRSE